MVAATEVQARGGGEAEEEPGDMQQYDGSIKWISMRTTCESFLPPLSCLPLCLAFPFHQRPSASSPAPTPTPSPFPSAAGRGGAPSRELITNLRAFMPTNCHVFSQVTAQLSRA